MTLFLIQSMGNTCKKTKVCFVVLYNKSLFISAGTKVAFKATMDPKVAISIAGSTESCFGPFNINVPIPYTSVTLNYGGGYNPSLGRKHTQM